MDCGGDSGEDSGGLEDFVDLATNNSHITDNSRTIRGNLFIAHPLTSKYYLCVTSICAQIIA